MSVFERLRARWVEAGLRPKPGVSQETLDRFENKRKIVLPSGFKRYLLTVNGMEEGQTDEDLISFLSLEAIDQDANFKWVSASGVRMVVAEYCVYSHLYVLQCSQCGDRSSVLATDGRQEVQLATSFEDFVDKYLSNPTGIAHCWT